MYGVPVTGPILASLATSYISAMSDGLVPTISSAWQVVIKSECEDAVARALAEVDQPYMVLFISKPCQVLKMNVHFSQHSITGTFKLILATARGFRSKWASLLRCELKCMSLYDLLKKRIFLLGAHPRNESSNEFI